MMPANRSYDVFLLQPGTKLSLISQSFIEPQPTLKLSHDTQLFISKKIEKTSAKSCLDITMHVEMNCVMEKVKKELISREIACLPFYYWNVFPRLHGKLFQCQDDSDLATYNMSDIHFVRNSSTTTEMFHFVRNS